MLTNVPQCDKCAYFVLVAGSVGTCRVNPPTVGFANEPYPLTAFPEVLGSWWCGAFQPKDVS